MFKLEGFFIDYNDIEDKNKVELHLLEIGNHCGNNDIKSILHDAADKLLESSLNKNLSTKKSRREHDRKR